MGQDYHEANFDRPTKGNVTSWCFAICGCDSVKENKRLNGLRSSCVRKSAECIRAQLGYGVSERPDRADLKMASIARMFATASSIGTGAGWPWAMASQKRSQCTPH